MVFFFILYIGVIAAFLSSNIASEKGHDGTSYECLRRICTEMFEVGLLKRTKVTTGQKGRPSYLYGHK